MVGQLPVVPCREQSPRQAELTVEELEAVAVVLAEVATESVVGAVVFDVAAEVGGSRLAHDVVVAAAVAA